MERHTQHEEILPTSARNVTIAIVGAGAAGGFTALALAKMGYEKIIVWDGDVVAEHNVDNQLYGPHDVGQLKVHALHSLVYRLSGVSIEPRPAYWDNSQGAIVNLTPNIVYCAVDSIEERKKIWIHIADNPTKYGHYIDSRMGAEFFTIETVWPLDLTQQHRYEESFHPKEEILPVRCTQKSIMYTPFILAGLVANQVKLISTKEEYRSRIAVNMQGMLQILEYSP